VLYRQLHLVSKERDEFEELVFRLQQVDDELLFVEEVAGGEEVASVGSLVVNDVVVVVAASLEVAIDDEMAAASLGVAGVADDCNRFALDLVEVDEGGSSFETAADRAPVGAVVLDVRPVGGII